MPTTLVLASPPTLVRRRLLSAAVVSILAVSGCATPGGSLTTNPVTPGALRSQSGGETILHSFGNSNDGANPEGELIADASGTLYGTARGGGTTTYGTVFELVPSASGYAEKTLYTFKGGKDGIGPIGALVADASGNLFGVTTIGGGLAGNGTAFELTPSGSGYTKRTIYAFEGGSDGRMPIDGLVIDQSGSLYGVTYAGGKAGDGIAFKLSPNKKSNYRETVLHSFTGGSDGSNPFSSLAMDASGALYGVTYGGGAVNAGVVYELKPQGNSYTETVPYSFKGAPDGAIPKAPILIATDGSLYGTTYAGGSSSGCNASGFSGCGTVFQLTPSAKRNTAFKEQIVYSFQGGTDGVGPQAGLIADSSGALYSTTIYGGKAGLGTVYKLVQAGKKYRKTILHEFGSSGDGILPAAGLLIQPNALLGTTYDGGAYNQGTAFAVETTTSFPNKSRRYDGNHN